MAGCVREAGVGVAGAARYASCPAPAGSGADGPTWTGVVNQINGELQSAIQANRHFDALDAALEDLLVDSNSELQAVKALTDIPPKATGTSFDWAALLDDVIFVLADLVGIPGVGEGGEAAAAASQFLYTAADSLGAVVDGTSSPGGGRSEASTWAQVTTQVAQVQQAMEDGLDVRRAYALGDPGLRGALGSMQYAGVMPVNRAAVQNAGRRAFAEWAFKSLLPAHWNRYRVPDCQTGLGLECGPPRGTSPTYIYSSFSAGDTDGWDLATVTDPDGTECWVDTFTQGCDFADVSSLKPFIWAARDPACVYDPVARTGAWYFGRCSIGADQADFALGRDGWAFTGFTCVVIAANMGFDPCKPDDPANTVVRGSVPAGAAAGTVTLQATHDLGALAPAAGTVTAESLLVESTTRPPEDRELATQPTGLEHQPLRMTPTARPSAGSQGSGERTAMARRPSPVRATFRGRSGTQRASLTMTRSRLVLRVRGVRVGAPEACTKGARRVTLTTTLRLRPPGRPTARGTAVTLRGRWECRRGPQRAHAGLRLVAPRR